VVGSSPTTHRRGHRSRRSSSSCRGSTRSWCWPAEATPIGFGRTHSIGLEALFDAVLHWLIRDRPADGGRLQQQALADYRACGAKGRLSFMQRGLSNAAGVSAAATPPRQARHLRGAEGAGPAAIDTARRAML